jgi:hypothetical protein
MTISVGLFDKAGKDGGFQVYLRLYVKRRRVLIATGVVVIPGDWDRVRSRVKASDKENKDKNLLIHTSLARVTEIVKRYRLQYKELTPELLKQEYRIFSTYIDFYEFFDKAIAAKVGIITKSTVVKHRQVLRKMREWRPALMFSELNPDAIADFERWMKLKKGNGANTRVNNLKVVKQYCELAVLK